MKRVIIDNKYTYETNIPRLRVGNKVVLPTPYWLRDVRGNTWIGRITSMTSTYEGYCEKIISRA